MAGNIVVGVIPGSQPGIEDRMQNWLVESGMDADLATITLESPGAIVDNVRSGLKETGPKVIGLLVDRKLMSADDLAALEQYTRSQKMELYHIR